MKKRTVLIIGAGLSGLSLAYFLREKKVKAEIFEKEIKPGGLCRSIEKQGFVFDYSGHLLHFRNRNTLSLVNKVLNGSLTKHKRKACVYTFNKFIPYPFQANFNYLPKRVAEQCLRGFIEARKPTPKSGNFLQWIYSKFGKGIADHFMIPYNTKLWKIPLDELDHKWAERFIVVPTIEQIKERLTKKKSKSLGYNDSFWYPGRGGIEELINGFFSGLDNIHLCAQAVAVDLKKKIVVFGDGRKEKFDKLVSTIPLPELGKIITALPKGIQDSFEELRWISIYNVNLGVKARGQSGRHWIYFSQKDIPFFRIGFFHNFSSHLVPRGRGSLYVDISYSKDRPVCRREIGGRIRKYLIATGIIKDENEIYCENINDIKYGYPVYDKNYTLARRKILSFLSRNSVISCGRYGSWRYLSMEDVILEAEKIAKNKL